MVMSGGSADALSEEKTIHIHACFLSILSDPWFTSLWTLQEAYLRPDALFISKEGDSIYDSQQYPLRGNLTGSLSRF
jgi:hypothetical protein